MTKAPQSVPHKFGKVLEKHGFTDLTITDKVFVGHAYREYVYRNPSHKGRIRINVWPSKVAEAIHYYLQSNGITAPSVCDTAPQLDRNLTRHYIDKI